MIMCYTYQSILDLSILNYYEVIGMAEFCLECWNKIMNTNDPPQKYVLSKEADYCEECGRWKPVVIRKRRCSSVAAWICKWINGRKTP